jgi:hypothetical protein
LRLAAQRKFHVREDVAPLKHYQCELVGERGSPWY